MSHSTPHTIYLQDGTLCNLNRRIAKQAEPLVSFLSAIPDPRRAQGRRHSLGLILCIVFIALLRGSKDLKDARLYALTNQPFLRRHFAMPHGVPDPTTISRLLQVLEPETLVTAGVRFMGQLGIPLGDTYSFDGKTMRAVSGEDAVRHMLSLFSHEAHVALGQVGVTAKENEIPAFLRLLDQAERSPAAAATPAGKLLLGDALHTQKATVRAILKAGADYLFVVKGNQKQLRRAIEAELTAAGTDAGRHTSESTDGKHTLTTTVTAVTSKAGQTLVASLTGSNRWDGVRTVGVLHRSGTRRGRDGKTVSVNETVAFMSSRALSAETAAGHLHRHWCIENNLHWVKDVIFKEDAHHLRKGNAPQAMSWLRSLCISVCNLVQVRSISDTIHNLEKSGWLLGRFLRMAAVV